MAARAFVPRTAIGFHYWIAGASRSGAGAALVGGNAASRIRENRMQVGVTGPLRLMPANYKNCRPHIADFFQCPLPTIVFASALIDPHRKKSLGETAESDYRPIAVLVLTCRCTRVSRKQNGNRLTPFNGGTP
jgi:hypothetical protein